MGKPTKNFDGGKQPKFEASPYPRQKPPVAPKPIEHQAKAHRYEEKAADCLPEMEG